MRIWNHKTPTKICAWVKRELLEYHQYPEKTVFLHDWSPIAINTRDTSILMYTFPPDSSDSRSFLGARNESDSVRSEWHLTHLSHSSFHCRDKWECSRKRLRQHWKESKVRLRNIGRLRSVKSIWILKKTIKDYLWNRFCVDYMLYKFGMWNTIVVIYIGHIHIEIWNKTVLKNWRPRGDHVGIKKMI